MGGRAGSIKKNTRNYVRGSHIICSSNNFHDSKLPVTLLAPLEENPGKGFISKL